MAWIFLSIMAAAFQTLRFMLQKRLSQSGLSAAGATAARFFYAMPLALLTTAIVLGVTGTSPGLGMHFLPWVLIGAFFQPWVLIGAFFQVLATWAMVRLFQERNFAAGIAFKKTEVVQAALIGLVLLGDQITTGGFAAILAGLVGVLVLSDNARIGAGRFLNKAAGLGLFSGAAFALSAVGYRAATLEVVADGALERGVVTLSAVTLSQSIGMGLWLRVREPGEITRILLAWRQAGMMGLMSLGGSLGWFTAFAMMNAAYVFAVGQIEVVFSILASVLFFGERISGREYLGIALLTGSILGLIAFG
jgi:drug/metabolite transporter (DMT)-like permease